MLGKPQKITNDIIDQLNQFARGDVKPDEFTLKKLRNKTEKLLNVDPVEANVVLGIIATIARDEKEAIKRFESAMNRSNSPMVFQNYAQAMIRFGRTDEAAKLANDSLAMYGDDPSTLNDIADIAFKAGFFKFAENVIAKVEKLKSSSQKQLKDNTRYLGKHCEENNVSEADVSKLISIIYKITLKHDVSTPLIHFFDDPSKSDPSLFMSFCVHGYTPQEIVLEMNDDLVSELASDNISAVNNGRIVPLFSYCSTQ